jgi:hypothetical protein
VRRRGRGRHGVVLAAVVFGLINTGVLLVEIQR